MIQWPWVSRRAYDDAKRALNIQLEQLRHLIDQHERLVDQVVRLKRKGYELPTTGRVTAPPDPEAKALARVEQQFTARLQERRAEADNEFIASAAQDLIDRGMSPAMAKAEAARLRAAVTDMHPAGG